MKTSNNFNRRNSIAVASFMILSSLFFGSCQKDELTQPTSDKDASADNALRLGAPVIAPPHPSFRIAFSAIKIDHFAARTNLPDYSVTVNADGSVLFEGRRNVRVNGDVKFTASQAGLNSINQLCQAVNFYSIVSPQLQYADLPYVATSYTASKESRSKTLFDYNNGNPRTLVSFRTKIENALGISKLVDKQNTIDIIPDPNGGQ